MKMAKKMLLAMVIIAATLLGFTQAKATSTLDFELQNILKIDEAKDVGKPPCWSWGYKNWDYEHSEINGVDCDCYDRDKVRDLCTD